MRTAAVSEILVRVRSTAGSLAGGGAGLTPDANPIFWCGQLTAGSKNIRRLKPMELEDRS